MANNTRNISDYSKFIVDLRRHMWMAGIEMDLRRLIWQIAITGKYISAKIHESNRKLAGLRNIHGDEQLALDGPAQPHAMTERLMDPSLTVLAKLLFDQPGGEFRKRHDPVLLALYITNPPGPKRQPPPAEFPCQKGRELFTILKI